MLLSWPFILHRCHVGSDEKKPCHLQLPLSVQEYKIGERINVLLGCAIFAHIWELVVIDRTLLLLIVEEAQNMPLRRAFRFQGQRRYLWRLDKPRQHIRSMFQIIRV